MCCTVSYITSLTQWRPFSASYCGWGGWVGHILFVLGDLKFIINTSSGE